MLEVIAFVEDPGVANFFVYNEIQKLNYIKIFSVEPAYSYLKNKNVHSINLNDIEDLNCIFSKKIKLLITGTSENKKSLAFKLIEISKK